VIDAGLNSRGLGPTWPLRGRREHWRCHEQVRLTTKQEVVDAAQAGSRRSTTRLARLKGDVARGMATPAADPRQPAALVGRPGGRPGGERTFVAEPTTFYRHARCKRRET